MRGPANSAACETLTTAGEAGRVGRALQWLRQPRCACFDRAPSPDPSLTTPSILPALPACPLHADRTSSCTDIAPDAQFTCAEQLKFGKCGEWLGAGRQIGQSR